MSDQSRAGGTPASSSPSLGPYCLTLNTLRFLSGIFLLLGLFSIASVSYPSELSKSILLALSMPSENCVHIDVAHTDEFPQTEAAGFRGQGTGYILG